MIIRDGTPADGHAVHRLVVSAFGQQDEACLIDELRCAGDVAVELVADEGAGEIAGHVLLSRMHAPFPALALAPVSVAPPRQRAGIGSALVNTAVARARDAGWSAIFVLGDPHFYARFGFSAASAEGFASPYAGPHFMALALTGALPVAVGELRHAPAFAALE
jgi:putative acetyltransferase